MPGCVSFKFVSAEVATRFQKLVALELGSTASGRPLAGEKLSRPAARQPGSSP